MTLRDRVLALAARGRLGDQAPAVLKLLCEARQGAVVARVEAMRALAPEAAMQRLAALRARQARRVGRLARSRFGDGWSRLDPLVRDLVLHHGQRQDH
jgi:hypothetical protein